MPDHQLCEDEVWQLTAERDEARRELAALKSSFELVRNANRKVSADLAAANRVLDALARERP